MDSSMPGFPVLHHLPEFAQTHVPWISDAIQSSHPRLPPSPLALSPSQHTSLFNESAFHITWQKYWSFIFSTSPSNSGLISFYTYWFDLLDFLDVQGILKSLLQHHSLKTAVFQSSVSSLTCIHDYWKNYRFDYMDFVGKVMSLLLNTLSTIVMAILSRSKCLFISWLPSLSAVILKPKKMKSDNIATFSPFICHEVIGLESMVLVSSMLSFKPTFSRCSFTIIKRLFSSFSLSAIKVISEVVDISPGNLDSSLWFIQPGISHNILCI